MCILFFHKAEALAYDSSDGATANSTSSVDKAADGFVFQKLLGKGNL